MRGRQMAATRRGDGARRCGHRGRKMMREYRIIFWNQGGMWLVVNFFLNNVHNFDLYLEILKN